MRRKTHYPKYKPMKPRTQIEASTWRLARRIARNIKKLRLKRGLTQQDMEALGFSLRWYQKFESGKHMPTIPTLDKLSKALKVDIQEFFQ